MIKYINKNFNKKFNKNFNKNISEYKEIFKFFIPIAILIFGYWKGLKKTFKTGYESKCQLNNKFLKYVI